MNYRPFAGIVLVAAMVVLASHAYANRGSRTVASSSPAPQSSDDIVLAADTVQGCHPTAVGSGSYKVGIQAGHLNIANAADELYKLKWDFGGSSNGVNEVDVTTDIATRAVALLKAQGVSAEMLDATVPEDYCANAFVSVHADGNDDTSVYGFKAAPSDWDTDGQALALCDDIVSEFGKATSMDTNPTITDDMTQYYSFNHVKYVHSIDPNTQGVLLEVGFITNPTDRVRMVSDSQDMAQGLVNGIMRYLKG